MSFDKSPRGLPYTQSDYPFPDDGFALAHYRSALVIIRHYVDAATPEMGARMYREINRDVMTPLSARADVKILLAKQSHRDIDSVTAKSE